MLVAQRPERVDVVVVITVEVCWVWRLVAVFFLEEWRLSGWGERTSVGPVAVNVVVGLGPRRQEHPLETRAAGYWLTKVGKGSSSRVKLFG